VSKVKRPRLDPGLKTVSYKTRDLMRRVADGNPNNFMFMYSMVDFRRRDDMLVWLIKNNITGLNLQSWLDTLHKRTILGPLEEILSNLEREDKKGKLQLDRDMIRT